jgi:hypothetical protein
MNHYMDQLDALEFKLKCQRPWTNIIKVYRSRGGLIAELPTLQIFESLTV